jgi:hypothetical protein
LRRAGRRLRLIHSSKRCRNDDLGSAAEEFGEVSLHFSVKMAKRG